MKVHPRHKVVAAARFAIADAIDKATAQHELTYAELLLILADQISAYAGHAIQGERQG